jgi:hypothetical protein
MPGAVRREEFYLLESISRSDTSHQHTNIVTETASRLSSENKSFFKKFVGKK